MKHRLLRWIVYFRRGHSSWFAMALGFLNFIVIQYRLLIENVPFLKNIFVRLWVFALLFIAVYVPVATLVGWIDYKRLTKPREVEADYYYVHPTYKEKEYFIPAQIITLEALIKLMKKQGMDTRELEEMKKKLLDFLNS